MSDNYSNWQKIDLHIHTDWSRKTKENDYNGLFSVDRLKEKMIENDVSIFSLTDHNIINIDAYKKYYSTYNEETDPLLLVGVELDIEVTTEAHGTRTYHTLLIFNYSSAEKAEEIHQRLEKRYSEKGEDIFKRSLDIDDVVALFPDDDFFFIPHAGDTKSIVKEYVKKGDIEEAQKMVLLMPSAFEKVKQARRQKYNEGFDKILDPEFRKRNDIPYINFSDNHNIEQYPLTGNGGTDSKQHEFYYVKGGRSYETLRLAFIDPESRIKSASQLKEVTPSFNYIEGVQILGDKIIKDIVLKFSPHLNVLIGGRSSGKSLMMSILGDKIDSLNTDKNKYGVGYDDIEIKSKYDMLFTKSASISKDEVIYIKQGDIVRYFEEQRLEDLAKESGKALEYERAKVSFIEHKRKLEEKHEGFLRAYNDCEGITNQNHILHNSTIENILKVDFILNWNETLVKTRIEDSKKIDDAKLLLTDLMENVDKVGDLDIVVLSDKENDTIKTFQKLIQSKLDLIKKKEIINKRKLLFVESVGVVIDQMNDQLDEGARSKSQSRKDLDSFINKVEEKFKSLVELKNQCNQFSGFDYSHTQHVSIDEKVTLVLEVVSKNSIKELILDGINGGKIDESMYQNITDVLRGKKSIKNYANVSTDTLRKKSRVQISGVLNAYENPKDYLTYSNGETSKKNSPGYNSEKYLEVILKNPKSKVIFIDQPEDNLGNKFITETLVSLIRNIKFQKQIFLVTHNPSIVVYGDAESIVIAENSNNQIEYKQVVLEKEEFQKEICEILDGGEYIFNMRAKKYNIKRILKNK